jgi:hypothetical protein
VPSQPRSAAVAGVVFTAATVCSLFCNRRLLTLRTSGRGFDRQQQRGKHLATRQPLAAAAVATAPVSWVLNSAAPRGTPFPCRNLLACQFGGGNPKPPAPVDSPLWSTGQAVFQHYKDSLPPIDPDYADKSKLRVSREREKAAAQATAVTTAAARRGDANYLAAGVQCASSTYCTTT